MAAHPVCPTLIAVGVVALMLLVGRCRAKGAPIMEGARNVQPCVKSIQDKVFQKGLNFDRDGCRLVKAMPPLDKVNCRDVGEYEVSMEILCPAMDEDDFFDTRMAIPTTLPPRDLTIMKASNWSQRSSVPGSVVWLVTVGFLAVCMVP